MAQPGRRDNKNRRSCDRRFCLFGFLVRGVFLAPLAELAQLKALFERLLVLPAEIADLLAGRALEFDQEVL